MTLTKYWLSLPLTLLKFPPPLCLASDYDCKKHCSGDSTDPNYRPQECSIKCRHKESLDEDDFEDLLEEVTEEVSTLKIMVITLLALVSLILALFMINLATNRKLKKVILKFYSKLRNKDSEPSTERDPRSPNKEENARIANSNYPASYSPTASRGGPYLTSSIRRQPSSDVQSRESPYKTRRARMPSESTCPDDSQAETTGYDNLALSTSTISFHSRPSSPSSPVDTRASSDNMRVSIATLSTTVV